MVHWKLKIWFWSVQRFKSYKPKSAKNPDFCPLFGSKYVSQEWNIFKSVLFTQVRPLFSYVSSVKIYIKFRLEILKVRKALTIRYENIQYLDQFCTEWKNLRSYFPVNPVSADINSVGKSMRAPVWNLDRNQINIELKMPWNYALKEDTIWGNGCGRAVWVSDHLILLYILRQWRTIYLSTCSVFESSVHSISEHFECIE